MKALALASVVGLMPLGAALAGEHAANEFEIRKLIVGHGLKCGGADCRYGADGSYSYNGGTPGQYTISPGSICVKFLDGSNRCDRVVVNDGGAYTIINSYGQRLSLVRPDLQGQGTNPGLNPSLEPLYLQRPSLTEPLARPTLIERSGTAGAAGAASPQKPRVGAPAPSGVGILAPAPSGLSIGQPQPNALGVSPQSPEALDYGGLPAAPGVVAPQVGPSQGVTYPTGVYEGGISPSGAGLETPAGLGANAIAPTGYGEPPQAGAVVAPETGVGAGASSSGLGYRGLPAAASGAAAATPAAINSNPYLRTTPEPGVERSKGSGKAGGSTGRDGDESGQ